MSESRHILFLTPGFPKDENDFNCVPPLQDYLIKFKQVYPETEFSVIAFQYPYYKSYYKWNGITIYPLGGKNNKAKKPLVWLKTIVKAIKIHNLKSINAIHSLWLGECAMIGNVLSKKFKCKHICTLMGQDVKKSNRYLNLLKNIKCIIVALSRNQEELFYNLTNRNTNEIIHWGIMDQQFSYNEREIDLLAVGSLIPLKNYSLFIKLVDEIIKIKSDLKAVLVGAGSELSKLKIMAIENGIEKNIEFKGSLNRKDIFELMQKSRIFVHPSLFEGSGFVFAEALANGMNIVSFNVGYAQNHSKWFIAKDEQELFNITKKLLNEKLDFNPANVFPLIETINRYSSLYGIN
jgi:glycosyltransferase involved in cell wall biosynthesis